MAYILSIDQGTSSSRAILFDELGNPKFSDSKLLECIYPHSGWVEQNANDLFNSVIYVISNVLAKANVSFDEIKGIGITNQRETTIVWEKKTGRPVYNAIVWQSRQTDKICDALNDKKDLIHKKTGLLINPYFSASKIRFILDNIPNGQERANNGELLFGTVDTWLIYKLTNGKTHATDFSNASRTLLFNIFTLDWDEELLKLFNIPRNMLPKVLPSSADFGSASILHTDTKICGVAGDQQAALFGQRCFSTGDIKNTYGTGCFLLANTGKNPFISKNGLLTTIAWNINGEVTYALEGSVFIGGSIIKWLKDELEFFKESKQSFDYAIKADDTHNIYVVPAFVGLGAPYWDNDARGAIFGMTRNTNKYHITRASLEAIAFECEDVIRVMKKDTNLEINTLAVDGGASVNSYLMQFQSDISRCEIKVPTCLETTALGVCFLAGLYAGVFKSLDDLKRNVCLAKSYYPTMDKSISEKRYKKWLKAVEATRIFK